MTIFFWKLKHRLRLAFDADYRERCARVKMMDWPLLAALKANTSLIDVSKTRPFPKISDNKTISFYFKEQHAQSDNGIWWRSRWKREE